MAKPVNLELSSWPGWEEVGYLTLKRIIWQEQPISFKKAFPRTLSILIPDLQLLGRIPSYEELLFFDLETTGLSGGAGTIAFLAAFGRFIPVQENNKINDSVKLQITQYLLLDYPGEPDFMDRLLLEFAPNPVNGRAPIIVSYNGKCFDSQILRNRCLMNGLKVPFYYHADLLHPARRLWKQVLPDCSQSTVETSILGLSREGDVSGAFAPDIWFSFLKTGENTALLSICEHNIKDISGLSSIFIALLDIAGNPLKNQGKYRFKEEALALYWAKLLKKFPGNFDDGIINSGRLLLEKAMENGSVRVAIVLAKNAEWQLKNPLLALNYVETALASPKIDNKIKEELETRQVRLLKKTINFDH